LVVAALVVVALVVVALVVAAFFVAAFFGDAVVRGDFFAVELAAPADLVAAPAAFLTLPTALFTVPAAFLTALLADFFVAFVAAPDVPAAVLFVAAMSVIPLLVSGLSWSRPLAVQLTGERTARGELRSGGRRDGRRDAGVWVEPGAGSRSRRHQSIRRDVDRLRLVHPRPLRC
jgi:hypothetical protein